MSLLVVFLKDILYTEADMTMDLPNTVAGQCGNKAIVDVTGGILISNVFEDSRARLNQSATSHTKSNQTNEPTNVFPTPSEPTCQYLRRRDKMHASLLTTSLLLASAALVNVAVAAPHPQLSYVSAGTCREPGQFICVSATTFTLCDASLRGIVQSLALGDTRCQGRGHGQVSTPVPGSQVRPVPPPHNTPPPSTRVPVNQVVPVTLLAV